jgi:hypothetical protein
MGRALTFNPETAATILGARRVGAPLRQCAQAAGVPWRTFCDWLKAGRDGTDARFADFAAQVDTAGAQVDTVLHARVMKGTEKDPRLALDVIKYRDAARARTAELRLLKARGAVEEKRATGDHVDRVEVRNVSELTDAELIAEAERLQQELRAH